MLDHGDDLVKSSTKSDQHPNVVGRLPVTRQHSLMVSYWSLNVLKSANVARFRVKLEP